MTHDEAKREKDNHIRESQLDLFHLVQDGLAEISKEMLGNKEWDTCRVDRELMFLSNFLNDHFGDN